MKEQPLIVIADIHGNRIALEELVGFLDTSKLLRGRRLAFLGDFVDRGPDSKGVLDFVISLVADGNIAIAGNHDIVLDQVVSHTDSPDWANWLVQWQFVYGRNLLQSYGIEQTSGMSVAEAALVLANIMPESHKTFLSELPWFYETEDFVLVHAGIDNDKSWEEQRTTLQERALTFGHKPPQLFSHTFAERLYGNTAQPKWLVTGHKVFSTPVIDPTYNRAMLNCGSRPGNRLYAWITDLNRLVSVEI